MNRLPSRPPEKSVRLEAERGWEGFKKVPFDPSTKRTTGLPVGELVLWCGMFAPKGRLEWHYGLARGAPFMEVIPALCAMRSALCAERRGTD